jgi:hypothetical protein
MGLPELPLPFLPESRKKDLAAISNEIILSER